MNQTYSTTPAPHTTTSPHEADDCIIRLEHIYKSFGPLIVLNDLSLNVHKRESLVILGPSGTGKSVLLKHIIGLLRPDQGQIFFHQQRIDDLKERDLEPIRKRFGFLFQMGALFDSMTVGDNIAFPLREQGLRSNADIREIVAQKLAMVGLENIENKMPGDLSGGQRKRVALARAVALDPEVVLYDEPTTGLDPIRADVINELILKLNAELNVTTIVVTHDMNSAFKVGDRLVILFDGKVAAEGNADQIRHSPDPQVQRFVQGRASDEELQALRRYKATPLP